jgi:hypothetical protein
MVLYVTSEGLDFDPSKIAYAKSLLLQRIPKAVISIPSYLF